MLHVADAAGLARIESSIFSEDSRYDTVHSISSHINSNIYEYFNTVEQGQVPFVPITNSAFISTARNAAGETLLIMAARCGHANVVEYFLKEQIFGEADLEESDNEGWTALLNAAHEGHSKVAQLLVEAGASVDQSDLMGWTPLMWATYKNHLEVVKVLVDAKAHINIVGEEDGLTPLIISAGRGYTEIVQKLVASGAEVNSSDKFGSTALVWAARKGYTQIVEDLLSAGADLDVAGMYGMTALMLATKGNHIKVVNALLVREPNANAVDYNGLSALGIAAREGYTEIAQSLISASAFVNTVDRFGNSILASAVRSGNLTLVKMLLEKHADVNAKDSENRTPLHLAIDKSYTDIVLALLEKKPNLELKNKDGETSLLRAVKNKDVSLVQLLVNMGAKISATDVSGDNALHLSLRARSRKLTQSLLVNPSDSKLLYRPNKLGETPYSIDQETDNPILPTIFGPIGTDIDLKNLLGYDAYSDVLADVVCEPNLSLPLTVGLYSKWGSGKSLLLPKIRESMKSFSRSWLEGIELYWSWTLVFTLLLVCAFISLVIAALGCLITKGSLSLAYPLVIGCSIYVLLISTYGFIYYGSEIKLWNSSISTARLIARCIARFKILLSVLTLNAPIRTDKELVVSPVSFLFADDHRLSFIGGEQSLTNIVQSLFLSAEEHYGSLAVRLFSAFNLTHLHRNSKLQALCGIPVVLYMTIMLLSLISSLILFIKAYQIDEYSHLSYLIASAVLLAIFVISSIAPIYLLFIRLFVNLPKRRMNRISHKIHLMPFERIIQKLQKEVDLLVNLVTTLDAFTNSQTRMVIMVDGLDSCEQNKMLQILDALTLFFSSRQNAPFVVVLAADPHIITSGIQHSLRAGGGGANEITGQEYLKNIVTMPFFLDHAALKQLQASRHKSVPFNQTASFKERKRSETVRGSRMSLREQKAGDITNNQITTSEVSNLLPSYDYFSNISPRIMRRIVNSIALTGRLLRTFEVEFSWFMLYTWISLVEQWPYRMSWIILKTSEISEEFANMTLTEFYSQIKADIIVDRNLDRNHSEFEIILTKISKLSSRQDQLTVRHIRNFTPCTSNLDPYLRKVIYRQHGKKEDEEKEVEEEDTVEDAGYLLAMKSIGAAEFLFEDPVVWVNISKPLVKMPISDIAFLVAKLNIPEDRLKTIIKTFNANNLNGLVLQSCELDDLKAILMASLGDWTLIKLLIETLRKWKPILGRLVSTVDGQFVAQPSTNEENVLSNIEEEESNFGIMAVDEMEGREANGVDSDEDSDSTKSVIGSNQSLLKPPSRN